MTNYIPADKLIAEIERYIKHYEKLNRDEFKNGELYICQELLSFIKSLQQEQPSLPDNLDEAAREIVIKMHPCLQDCTILGDRLTRGQLMALVKAGAEWQKEQDTRDMVMSNGSYFQKCHELGRKDMKEQMMKEAVEGEVENSCFGIVYLRKNLMNEGYSTGDKVKIIIVKE